jgi:ADP-heptose:LPS heptosyltransferase
LARRLFPGLAFPNLKQVFKLNLEEAGRSVGNYLREKGVQPGDILIGLHPTLAKEDNRWSCSHYLSLMSLLPPLKGIRWVLFHGWGEDQQLEIFKKKMEAKAGVVILPTDDLFHLLAAASRCRVVVVGDSGLTHACALVTRVLALFGPSDPKQWGPLALHRPMVLRSKDHHCDSIPPERVAAALRKLISTR